jgi:ABC-type transport system involved in multi-copper enzyme maturation permease subunit
MSWVTWRQHRLEGAWSLGFGALLAASIGFVAYQLHAANCPGLVDGYCFDTKIGGTIALQIVHYNLYQYGLVVLPALAGAFIGCPLVAREVENGTHRLAWTQGVTRLRWLTVKLVLVFVPLLILAGAVGILEVILVNQQGTGANHWAFFDQQAPMTIAATLFALALGVAAGALVGKSVPAMAVTLVAFVVVRIGLAEIARPSYIAPLTYTAHDLASYNPAANPTAWWLDQPSYYDSAGRLLSTGGPGGPGPQAAYVLQHFQPGDRFWTFQAIESTILVGLAAVLIGFAIYWVTRRVS